MGALSIIGGLKTAADIVIGISKLTTMIEVKAKAIELQEVILSVQGDALAAQSEQFSLLDQIRDLEKQLADIKAWETEKLKYQLTEITTGIYAYVMKEETHLTEPPHKICCNCYQHGKKSILQRVVKGLNELLHCQCCNAEMLFYKRKPKPMLTSNYYE